MPLPRGPSSRLYSKFSRNQFWMATALSKRLPASAVTPNARSSTILGRSSGSSRNSGDTSVTDNDAPARSAPWRSSLTPVIE